MAGNKKPNANNSIRDEEKILQNGVKTILNCESDSNCLRK